MRRTTIITTALAATAALAVGPVGGASAKKATQLDCGLKLFAQGQPNPSGIQFGVVTCQEPFGNGVHYDEYTVTPPRRGTERSPRRSRTATTSARRAAPPR